MKEKLTTIGGMVTALLAISCCIGPALFLAFGITGLGFLSVLKPFRPYLLGLTFVLVAVAYWHAYGRGSSCGPGGACSPRARKIHRALFWVLVGFAAFGLGFPYAGAWLLG